MKYYIYLNNEVKGPYDIEELKGMSVTRDVKVCPESSRDWEEAGSVAELNNIFSNETDSISRLKDEMKRTEHIKEDKKTDEKIIDKKNGKKKKIIIAAVIIAALCICGLIYSIITGALPLFSGLSGGRLLFTEVDVRQGDSEVVITPNKKVMIIDGGDAASYYKKVDYGLRVVNYLKKKGVNKIDIIVASHAHADHIGGLLTVIKKIKTKMIIDSGYSSGSKLYKRFLETIKKKGIKYILGKEGTVIHLDKKAGVKAEIISSYQNYKAASSKINNSSITMRLTYKKIAIMLTGDIEREIENRLVRSGKNLKANILKSAHHGSNTSSTMAFLRKVSPEYIVISVGRNNKFRLPDKNILDRYKSLKAKLYRTDLNGTVEFLTDGKKISVTPERVVSSKELFTKLN